MHRGWTFKQVRGYNSYPATVPGGVHTDLLDNKLIEDPFFRLNERNMQWIDKEDWIYETSFDVEQEIFNRKNISICFDGLDTFADVTLNGEKIISADNMFRSWKADIKSLLKESGNKLQVYFHSPIKKGIILWDALPFPYEASNDYSQDGGVFDKKVSVVTRKAPYHYGWDWGPRLVPSGIWRPVYLEAWDAAKIQDVQYIQTSVTSRQAQIDVAVEIFADHDMSASLTLLNQTDNRKEATQKVNLKKGFNKIPLSFKLKNPRLWWTNGLGESFLYDFITQLSTNNTLIESHEQKIGLRSIKIITKPDQYGESFYFELNGHPIFAKGSNYIPSDNFLTRVTDSMYEKTILDAVNANMNMLRIWGGGIYENKIFYDLCDKYGILVWQDFMFACAMYPTEGELLENIRQEAIENVRRLRNHPSIAVWCGNNECLDAWMNWGWKRRQDQKDPQVSAIMWKQFKDLYFETLPAVVAEHHPGIDYRKTSPYSDDQGTRDPKVGDSHYWEVWQGRKPLSQFLHEKSRFFSEYGFQSFPEFESIKKYAPEPEDWAVTSEVMMAHQKGGMLANERILNFLKEEYKEPQSLQSFVYMSQLLQADAMKMAMETHRRDMPYCMGSLVWQHNDCWPVASWASRDYYGRWKAQHYFTVKSFAEILVAPLEEGGKLNVYVVSDRLKSTSGTLTVQVIDLKKGEASTKRAQVSVPANTSTQVWNMDVTQLLNGLSREDAVIHLIYKDKNGTEYENNCFLAKHKDMRYQRPQITTSMVPTEGGYELTMQSNVFARGVFVSLNGKDEFISDNYMDLLPGVPVKIKVTTSLTPAEFEKNLKITSFADQ
ncbi:MAG: glycoside hydrolase family 2 protein [Bacteroides sp.]|nr:glycoside hydrolase family 2 protein [Bacteroides sp.]